MGPAAYADVCAIGAVGQDAEMARSGRGVVTSARGVAFKGSKIVAE